MTNEEAKVFLDNLKICIEEHPIVADWLVEIADRKTEPSGYKMKPVEQTEPQTDTHDIHTDTHDIHTDTHDKVETMSCQECKWWFTDSLKHGGYCQSLLYNHECRYEPEVDCSWK